MQLGAAATGSGDTLICPGFRGSVVSACSAGGAAAPLHGLNVAARNLVLQRPASVLGESRCPARERWGLGAAGQRREPHLSCVVWWGASNAAETTAALL